MKESVDAECSKISDKPLKNNSEDNDLVLQFVRPYPVSKPPSGCFHIFCLRLTIALCVGGAIVGFCLLLIGGFGKDYYLGTKRFMYIGVMCFIVSVLLLVILCATWGTGGPYLKPEDLVITVPCTCQCASEYPPGHLIIPCSDIEKNKNTNCHIKNTCNVKNCICQGAFQKDCEPVDRQLPEICEEDFIQVTEPSQTFHDKQRQVLLDDHFLRHEKLDIYKWLQYTEEPEQTVSFAAEMHTSSIV